jgi:hypothetical protein
VLSAIRQLNPKIEETLTQMSANLLAEIEARPKAHATIVAREQKVTKHPEITLTPSEIYELIKRDYPEYYRLVTFQQVLNISRHTDAGGPWKATPNTKNTKKCIKIPLSKGWHATLGDSRLKLYPPAKAIHPD